MDDSSSLRFLTAAALAARRKEEEEEEAKEQEKHLESQQQVAAAMERARLLLDRSKRKRRKRKLPKSSSSRTFCGVRMRRCGQVVRSRSPCAHAVPVREYDGPSDAVHRLRVGHSGYAAETGTHSAKLCRSPCRLHTCSSWVVVVAPVVVQRQVLEMIQTVLKLWSRRSCRSPFAL